MSAAKQKSKSEREAPRSVAVIGAGAAGLAAACALAEAGYKVHVIERKPFVGGRACSYQHPGAEETIDNCQHILLGCCTNLIYFFRRLGVADRIHWSKSITFVEPGGRRSTISPGWLPAPLHASWSFWRAPAFSVADKVAIARGILQLGRGVPQGDKTSFAEWLITQKQPAGAVQRFWKPVMLSALNDQMDRLSLRYAGKVIQDAFLASAEGGRMGVPTMPLSELYGAAVSFLRARGGSVALRTSAEQLCWDGNQQQWQISTPQGLCVADAVIVALPFEGANKLCSTLPSSPARDALTAQLAGFEHSPITGVHLWFDRAITELPHAALLDSPIHWLYNTSRIRGDAEHYVELVVSASKAMVTMERQAVIDLAMRELVRFFPAVREAKLLKAAVVKEVRATYSVRPGLDQLRPAAHTAWPRLYLAGDWTATGWPATMEGAVRSGYLAAEALSRDAGAPLRAVQPDLPKRGWMAWA